MKWLKNSCFCGSKTCSKFTTLWEGLNYLYFSRILVSCCMGSQKLMFRYLFLFGSSVGYLQVCHMNKPTSYHDFIVLTLQPRRPEALPLPGELSREHRQQKVAWEALPSGQLFVFLYCALENDVALLFLLPVCCRTFLKYRQAEWIKKWSLSMSWSHRDSFLIHFKYEVPT